MRTSTHTLDPDQARGWRLATFPKARRQPPAGVGLIEPVRKLHRATDERAVCRPRQALTRPGLGDALDFALFAVTLVAIGGLHFGLLALLA